jgi:hypothetical protein
VNSTPSKYPRQPLSTTQPKSSNVFNQPKPINVSTSAFVYPCHQCIHAIYKPCIHAISVLTSALAFYAAKINQCIHVSPCQCIHTINVSTPAMYPRHQCIHVSPCLSRSQPTSHSQTTRASDFRLNLATKQCTPTSPTPMTQ